VQLRYAGRRFTGRASWSRCTGELSRRRPPYFINGSKLVTALVGTPIRLPCTDGDKYFAARSGEFGYANYEIIPRWRVDPLGPIGTSPKK
jgi:hypothetical protein